MEFLYSLAIYSSKLVVTVALILFGLITLLMAVKGLKSAKKDNEDKLKFTDLKKEFKERKQELEDAIFEADSSKTEKEKKAFLKQKAKDEKKEPNKNEKALKEKIEKAEKEGKFCPEKVFVIEFYGDPKASSQDDFIKEINAVLDVATDKDELILNLESPGGVVNGYGLLASQLERVREKGIHLTVCVDNVAASGGYLMSCVANKIVAAPFSYVGSIGVVAQIPNFNKVLKNHDVDYELVTAGKYKRTLTMFGENTEEGREKFRQELVMIHDRFKAIVAKYRPNMDVEQFATGEFWLATDAKERGLVDQIDTFDAYLQKTVEFTKVCVIKISIEHEEKKSFVDIIKKFFMAKTWTKAIKNEVQDTIIEQDTGRF